MYIFATVARQLETFTVVKYHIGQRFLNFVGKSRRIVVLHGVSVFVQKEKQKPIRRCALGKVFVDVNRVAGNVVGAESLFVARWHMETDVYAKLSAIFFCNINHVNLACCVWKTN